MRRYLSSHRAAIASTTGILPRWSRSHHDATCEFLIIVSSRSCCRNQFLGITKLSSPLPICASFGSVSSKVGVLITDVRQLLVRHVG
uniref:Secreted protein n=1 Tax=Mesocestoides corti TaxID=53468 RepID=A0A5K3FD28_MESCO